MREQHVNENKAVKAWHEHFMSKQILKIVYFSQLVDLTDWLNVGCLIEWVILLNIIKSILTLMITIASHLFFFIHSLQLSYILYFFFKRQFTCKKFILLNEYEKELNSVLSVLYSQFFILHSLLFSLNIIKWTIKATKICSVHEITWMKTSKFWMRIFCVVVVSYWVYR
jgi:hypothetical protein